jgi:septum formation protein
VEPVPVDESRYPDEVPANYVERVARAKAEAVCGPGRMVVAADTVVVMEGAVLGKPAHPAEARATLARLAGHVHEVLTGVAVGVWEGQARVETAHASTLVRLLPLTNEEIADYVATGEPLDKAGSYAVQGIGSLMVESVEGNPWNVMGLPVHLVGRLARALGADLLSFR